MWHMYNEIPSFWHIESKQILQPPKYLIIIVNRITYSNNRITKNKSRMPLCLWIYILNWALTNFPYKLLWTIIDTLWTVVITQPQSIVVGKHSTVTIIKLLNVISRIPIIHLLPIYLCTNSWNVRAAKYVLKGVCRCWHCRVFTAWPWRMGADRLPRCRHSCLPLQQVEE